MLFWTFFYLSPCCFELFLICRHAVLNNQMYLLTLSTYGYIYNVSTFLICRHAVLNNQMYLLTFSPYGYMDNVSTFLICRHAVLNNQMYLLTFSTYGYIYNVSTFLICRHAVLNNQMYLLTRSTYGYIYNVSTFLICRHAVLNNQMYLLTLSTYGYMDNVSTFLICRHGVLNNQMYLLTLSTYGYMNTVSTFLICRHVVLNNQMYLLMYSTYGYMNNVSTFLIIAITLSPVCKKFRRRHYEIFCLSIFFFKKTGFDSFMGTNCMEYPVFRGKIRKKIHQIVVCWISPKFGKGKCFGFHFHIHAGIARDTDDKTVVFFLYSCTNVRSKPPRADVASFAFRLRGINPFMLKGTLASSVDLDQTPQNAASDKGLHCLH